MSDIKSFITLCSGRGSNFNALLESYAKNELSAKPMALISSSIEANAVEIAKNHGLPYFILPNNDPQTRDQYLIETVNKLKPDFIVLAGYLKLIPSQLVTQFKNKILNIHPSLLPKHGGKGMYGLKVHQSVIDAKDTKTGATVHFLTEVFDEGPILLQEELDVLPNETAEELSKRVFEIEHKLLSKAINKFVLSIK
jgi:phosphoribosylglycinamide formyltransferase-1